MRRIPVSVFPDPESLAFEAAEAFVRLCGEALLTRERIAVALTGGSTPKRLFELLASPAFAGRLNWERIHFFWSAPSASEFPNNDERGAKRGGVCL